MSKATHRWLLAAALVLLCGLVTAAPAAASRKATAKQAAALTRAVHTSTVGGLNIVSTSKYRVTGARVSTVSKSWATAQLVATPKARATFQNAYVIAVQPAGTAQWVVLDGGTAEVGCGIAPDRVIADLLGIKDVANACPKGEGIS